MASPFTASKPHRSRPEGLDPASVHQFVEDLLGEDLHAKRVLSLANGVVGVLHGATLAIHAIGQDSRRPRGPPPSTRSSRSIAC